MLRIAIRFCGVIALLLVTLFVPGCARDQQLTSITLIPTTVTFQGIGAQLQFKAIGNYIHPSDTKDITNSVIWSSNALTVATINSTGLATGTNTCGSGEIIATYYSDPSNPTSGTTIVATAQVVDGNNNGICP
ncbi:MAG: Ig-like domain-containing protein [Terriglobales bacterium]|jgi:hypothetical protein